MRRQCGVTSRPVSYSGSLVDRATVAAGFYRILLLLYRKAITSFGYWLLWVEITGRLHVPKTKRLLLAVWDSHTGSAPGRVVPVPLIGPGQMGPPRTYIVTFPEIYNFEQFYGTQYSIIREWSTNQILPLIYEGSLDFSLYLMKGLYRFLF
jgi:hypothetical protein